VLIPNSETNVSKLSNRQLHYFIQRKGENGCKKDKANTQFVSNTSIQAKVNFFMLPQNLFWGEHIVAASSVRPCVRPSVHNFCPGYFSAINDRNSIKLYGKLHYQEEMCILSAGSGRMIFHRVMAL